MTKTEYLGQDNIAKFCKWFAERLESHELAHSWTDRRSGQVMAFQHVYDAYEKYAWPFTVPFPGQLAYIGKSFDENHNVLTILQAGLRKSVAYGQDAETLKFSHATVRWGGVFANNGKWLSQHQKSLSNYFAIHVVRLGDNADDSVLSELTRFNSGMSKIYSLLADNFVIYDSRVAAALGWIIVKFCRDCGINDIPETLRFPWASAKEAKNAVCPKCRNPSENSYRFPRLRLNAEYARWNLRASWILTEVINLTQTKFMIHIAPLRALEAALFMIGYDLGSSGNQDAIILSPKIETEIFEIDESDFPLCTRGNSIRFRYEYTDGCVFIENENGRIEQFEKHKVEDVLSSLYQQFGNNWFPLANNVEKLGDGTEMPGLGSAILKAYPGNISQAQAASYFGPSMEEVGLFEWNGKSRGIAWRLASKPGLS